VVSDEPLATLRADPRAIDRLLAKAGIIFGVGEARAATVERSLAVPFSPPKRRKKRERYIVTDVTAIQGLARTNLVVSAQDAMNLKAEDVSSKILQKCRVLVIVSSPIGGIEGTLPTQLAMNGGAM
jgi:hypothetical protein